MAAQKFPVKSLSKNKHVTYRHFYLANTTAQKDAVMHCHKHGEAPREMWSPSGVRTGQNKFPSQRRTLCYVQQLTCTQGTVVFLFSEHHSTKHGEAPRELWSPSGVRTGQNKFPSQ